MAVNRTVAVTLVGDGVIGKTCLLMRHIHHVVPDAHIYVPTVFEDHASAYKLPNNETIIVQFRDTAGQEEYDSLRIISYNTTNVFLLCYSLNQEASLSNCQLKWKPELRKYNKCPIILVGTKADLLSEEELQQKILQGNQMAKTIKASGHFVTSAVTGEGIKQLMNEAISQGVSKPASKCVLL